MPKKEKIKVLKGVPFAIRHDKSLMKAFETFCYLKHYYNGHIWKYFKRIDDIADKCEISPRTLNTRIYTMKKAGWIRTINGHIVIESWESLLRIYHIKESAFYFTKIELWKDQQKLEFFLETKDSQEHKKFMFKAYKRKCMEDVEFRKEICRKAGISDSDIELLPDAHLSLLFSNFLNSIDCGVNSTPNRYNPYFNVNCKTGAALLYNRTSPSSFTYTKRKWVRFGLAWVEKVSLTSEKWAGSCTLGTRSWNDDTKHSFLTLPDNVVILKAGDLEALQESMQRAMQGELELSKYNNLQNVG